MINNRVDVISYGCSKNLVDSERLMYQFAQNGYDVVFDSEEPEGEIVVINTCGFIGDAKMESIDAILSLAKKHEEGQCGKIYVMGCLSERYREELKEQIPEVGAFYGKFDWVNLLADLGKKKVISDQRSLTTPSHYAYVKIAEGCDRDCAYCAIPLITGKYISRPMADIIQEVKGLVAHGIIEIQLIAQDLTYYGLDLYKEHRIAQLVEALAQIEGLKWIRLHYAYPNNFPYELLAVMKRYSNICAYLDVALQHVSTSVLKLMRRHIDKAETIDFIKRVRQEIPNITLRTTMLVGFPGETQADFDELKDFVKMMRFERLGAFAFSNEEGTYADLHYKDNVPEEVKQQRLEELMAIQTEIMAENNQNKVGQIFSVILDSEEEDYFVGRTEGDSPEVDCEVYVKKNDHLQVGKIYNIKIQSSDIYDLTGEVVF